jgi:tRNA pseudouridine55 synthase
MNPQGILLIDKPQGLTSHDVVDVVREKLNIKKIGHTGTLDPMATGLLILLIGKYTSKQADFQKFDKVYEGIIQLGIETDTWDIEGKILKEITDFEVDVKRIGSSINLLSGVIVQKIPKYSAVKYKGQTLYKLARKNKFVPDLNKKVTVDWQKWSVKGKEIFFKIKCSSGTYIRSLAYQLGIFVGSGATLKQLRRISIGDYSIDDAISLDKFKKMSFSEVINFLKK